jgi:hypothetical protein
LVTRRREVKNVETAVPDHCLVVVVGKIVLVKDLDDA